MAISAKSDHVKSGRFGCAVPGSPGCHCRAAVLRAFGGMTDSGAPYDSALAVALRVLRHHHPELGGGARELVERWIWPESIH
jgi:hypothetical protein